MKTSGPNLLAGTRERPGSLDELAYREIQRMLVRLEIPPTAAVDDADLARRLGIGRTPVRRALKRLALEGLVIIYPRRGTFATDISLESVSKMSDLRIELEGLAAEKAAENAATGSTERLSELLEGLRVLREARDVSGDAETLFDTFQNVHFAIYELAGNPYLTRVAVTHYQLSYRTWHAFRARLAPLTTHVDHYIAMVEAILAGDRVRARRLAAEKVANFRAEVRASI